MGGLLPTFVLRISALVLSAVSRSSTTILLERSSWAEVLDEILEEGKEAVKVDVVVKLGVGGEGGQMLTGKECVNAVLTLGAESEGKDSGACPLGVVGVRDAAEEVEEGDEDEEKGKSEGI